MKHGWGIGFGGFQDRAAFIRGNPWSSSAEVFSAFSFALGGVVTAVFSGSLAILASHAGWKEVLMTGMIVPSFTWVVQLALSAALLPRSARRNYWSDLATVCLLGSVTLLPAAAYNFIVSNPSGWISAANVLASVVLMPLVLFRRTARHGIASRWPVSWCATISVNMAIFWWVSRAWW